MAIIQPTTEKVNSRLLMKKYTGITENDTCERYESTGFVDREVQVTGTFGGATITLTGSNDDTNYVTLKDPLGLDISFTSAGIARVSDAPRYINVGISGGSSTSVNVTIANNATSM